MKLSTHTHPRYIVWLKYFMFVSAVVLLFELVYIDFVKYPGGRPITSEILDIFFLMLLYSIVMLISAYYFGQTITVINEGLLIEFLGKELLVSWDEVKELKSYRGKKRICVVLTAGLTPFHRLLGLIYGFSVKPAFIIYPTISDYELLVGTIKKHAQKN